MTSCSGVVLTRLKVIAHEKGKVMHALRADDPTYSGFGEAYFSVVNPGETKGWKRHKKMTLNLVVPTGEVLFLVRDPVADCAHRYRLGPKNFYRLTVPPGLWVAFHGSGPDLNLVLNLASIPHDPSESETLPLEAFSAIP